MALATFPGPELWPAKTKSQSPKKSCTCGHILCCSVARFQWITLHLHKNYFKTVLFSGLIHELPQSSSAHSGNFRFNADSKPLLMISRGTFCFANVSSNLENNILNHKAFKRFFSVFQKDLIKFFQDCTQY
jgi:hypothetical protein